MKKIRLSIILGFFLLASLTVNKFYFNYYQRGLFELVPLLLLAILVILVISIPIPNEKVIKSDGYTKFSRSETLGETTTRSKSKSVLYDNSICDGYNTIEVS